MIPTWSEKGRLYQPVELRGGPRNGHVIMLPIRMDGGVLFKGYRKYRTKHGLAMYDLTDSRYGSYYKFAGYDTTGLYE